MPPLRRPARDSLVSGSGLGGGSRCLNGGGWGGVVCHGRWLSSHTEERARFTEKEDAKYAVKVCRQPRGRSSTDAPLN
jgi:hypothetical protein